RYEYSPFTIPSTLDHPHLHSFPTRRSSDLAPSTGRGIPKSDWIEADAIIAGEGEAKTAFSLLKTKYGIQYRLIRFIHWLQTRKRSEEHTSELQSLAYLVCRLLLEKKKIIFI